MLDGNSVAEALRPLLQRLQEAESSDLGAAWTALESACQLLSALGGDASYAAAEELVAARGEELVKLHVEKLRGFRRDPQMPMLPRSLVQRLPRLCPTWNGCLEDFHEKSIEEFDRECARVLEALASGAPSEVWARRLAYSVELEAVIDSYCPESRSLASACALQWFRRSLPLLPWILAWLLLPMVDQSATSETLKGVRRALERCEDGDVLVQLRDAFCHACVLLLRLGWLRDVVPWQCAVLVAAHDACATLLPELPAASLAPFLVPLGGPPPAAPEELGAAWDLRSIPGCGEARAEELGEALARAVHFEASRSDVKEVWPGKMAPLLLLFRLLPDAGDLPLLGQARLLALRVFQATSQEAGQ